MDSSASTDNPYQAPGTAVVSETIVSPSPRHRFWLACVGWLFAPIAAAALYASRVPRLAIFVALVALWLVSVAWVVRSHQQKRARRSVGREIVVTVGLTISLACLATGLLSGSLAFATARGTDPAVRAGCAVAFFVLGGVACWLAGAWLEAAGLRACFAA